MKTALRAAVLSAAMIAAATGLTNAAESPQLRVLSGRADMVSGGEALVALKGTAAKVTLNGADVTAAFRPAEGGMIGLVTGIKTGKNELSAGGAKLELVGYPITGPIFSGPHQTPFACRTDAYTLPVTGVTLGAPLDANCSAKTRVDYVYKNADGKMMPLADPSKAPADVAQTKTSAGNTVNFIVRVETGTINRAIYQTALLHDPSRDKAPDPWNRPAGWNGRLMYNYGGGCNAGYSQAKSIAPVLRQDWLGLGFAVASSTLNTLGNNCNDVLSAETTMMVREHFIDHYGPVVHTIGQGCSGGAMQIHLIAQNYPGIFDGIIPTCTHPDVISYYTTTIADGGLLKHFFETTKQTWTTEHKDAVSGFANWDPVGLSWSKPPQAASPGWLTPVVPREGSLSGCVDKDLPADAFFDPVKNPKGARCTIYDNLVNVFGRDPKTGFARRPLDNIGVEYGLVAFNQGKISAEHFVSLNESIGGFDANGNWVAQRMTADPEALRIAYESGRIMTGGSGLATIPILDVHTYVDSYDHHARVDAFMARDRLLAANGDYDNQVLIELPGKNLNSLPTELLMEMDSWIVNIAKDPAPLSHAKVVRNKPAGLVDGCFTVDHERINEKATFDGPGKCNELYPSHGTYRIAAGAPVASDIMKCQLKAFDAKAYKQALSADQTARLKKVFATGVCDYSKPGVAQKIVKTEWLRF